MSNGNENQNIQVTIAERTPLNRKILISLGEGNRKDTKGPRDALPQTFNGPQSPEHAILYLKQKFNLTTSQIVKVLNENP